jgi:TPR repeat protein
MRHTAALLCISLSLAAGPARADYDSGQDAYQRGDFPRALAELTPVADQDARAATLLARIHAQGLGVARDAQQALLWLRKAGDLGDPYSGSSVHFGVVIQN